MRILTLLNLIIALLVFSIYLGFIEPYVQHTRWLNFLLFTFIFISIQFLSRKVEARKLPFLEKRLDKMVSLLIVIGLLFAIPYTVGLFSS